MAAADGAQDPGGTAYHAGGGKVEAHEIPGRRRERQIDPCVHPLQLQIWLRVYTPDCRRGGGTSRDRQRVRKHAGHATTVQDSSSRFCTVRSRSLQAPA